MKVKLDIEDAEALVSIANAFRGTGPIMCFTDRSRSTLRSFYLTAIMNAEMAIAESKRPKTCLSAAKRTAKLSERLET